MKKNDVCGFNIEIKNTYILYDEENNKLLYQGFAPYKESGEWKCTRGWTRLFSEPQIIEKYGLDNIKYIKVKSIKDIKIAISYDDELGLFHKDRPNLAMPTDNFYETNYKVELKLIREIEKKYLEDCVKFVENMS